MAGKWIECAEKTDARGRWRAGVEMLQSFGERTFKKSGLKEA
jgi:hypothetical protein